MNNVLEFLQDNWRYLALGALYIFGFIVQILAKKNPQVVDNSLIVRIADWIREAEDRFKVGEEKKSFVLSQAQLYLGDLYDKNRVSNLIESLLSLPSKKETK